MDTKEPLQSPLPGFLNDEQVKPHKEELDENILYESFKSPDDKANPFTGGPYQETLSSDLKGDVSESYKKAEEKIARTENLLQSWNLDEEVLPFVREVARSRGFDYILPKSESFRKRIEEQIEYVKWGEQVYAEGDQEKEGKYIPVGAVYINSEEGMFMLHRNIDEKENKLGDTYYLTRHYKRQKVNGKYLDFVDFVKCTVSDNDNTNDPVHFEMLDTGAKRFPMFRSSSGGNFGYVLYSSDYSKVPRKFFKGSPDIRTKVLKFINTKKPDGRLLSNIYWQMVEKPQKM